MSLVPTTHEGMIRFYQSKVQPWTTNAAAIGTTSTAVTAMGTRADAAEAKLKAQVAAKQAAKNATAELEAALRDLGDAGGDILKQIRTRAAIDGNGVYLLAEIPSPAIPAPVPPPGKPTNFTVTLGEDGALKLKWKCANPRGAGGTLYQVARRVGTGGEFVPIGVSGTEQFIDATLPAGASSVTYQVVGVRSTALGEVAQFTVNFGVTPTGAATAGVTPRLAA